MAVARLWKRNGDPVSLDCIDYSFSINRGVAGIPIPVLGERLGIDMNVVACDIRLNCILRDDDCTGAALSGKAAFSAIDFGRLKSYDSLTEDDVNPNYMTGDGGPITVALLNEKSFDVKTHYQANTEMVIEVKLLSAGTTHSAVASPHAILNVGTNGVTTGQGLAERVMAAMMGTVNAPITISAAGTGYSVGDALVTTGGGGSGFKVNITAVNASTGAITGVTVNDHGSGYSASNVLTVVQTGGSSGTVTIASNGTPESLDNNFTPTVVAASSGTKFTDSFNVIMQSGGNLDLGTSRLKIVHTTTGSEGNLRTYPLFWSQYDSDSTGVAIPFYEGSAGGTSHTCLSAGDKMQDLIGMTANSNVMGMVGSIFNISGKTAKGGIDADFKTFNFNSAADDYIVGLQLPYHSLAQKSLTDAEILSGLKPAGYEARNFLIVTGLTDPEHQNSAGNVNPASTQFDSKDMMTGIRGTVTGCGFRYNAGETTYGCELTFQPLDMIVGM
jgi:hypothetical protein